MRRALMGRPCCPTLWRSGFGSFPQQIGNFGVVVMRVDHLQRCLASLCTGVGISAAGKQFPECCQIPAMPCRKVKRCLTVLSSRVGIGTMGDQHLDHLCVSRTRCIMQRRGKAGPIHSPPNSWLPKYRGSDFPVIGWG
jgi:hypothetical protein